MAAQQGSFKINVSVINDEAVKKLKDINAQLYKAQAPLRAYQREVKRFNDLSGRTANLKKLQQGFEGLKNHFGKITGLVTSVGKKLLAVIGIGSIAGVVALTRSFANWGNEIRNVSALLGVTIGKAIQLSQMSKLSGSGDQTQQALKYQDAQEEVKYGRNPEAAMADKVLGINSGMSLEEAQVTAARVVREKLKNHKIDQYAARHAAELSGVGSIILDHTPEEIERMQAIARKNAQEMARFAKPAAKLRDTMAEASARVDVLKTRLAASLEPVITPLIEKFIAWSKDNKKVSETFDKITAAAKKVGDWIEKLDVKKLQDAFGKVVTVGETLLAVFVAIQAIKITSWAVSVVKDITSIATALGSLTTGAEAAGTALSAGTIAAGGAVLGAGAAAAYGVGSAGKEIYHDFYTPGGILENRQKRMKDRAYGVNWEGELQKNEDEYKLMNYATKQYGLTSEQAAGIMAQARAESGYGTQAIGDNGQAIGMFQWHPEREKRIEDHFGKKVTSMNQQEQLDAYMWEMKNYEPAAWKKLLQSKTIQDATAAGLSDERPLDWLNNGTSGQTFRDRTRLAAHAYRTQTGHDAPTAPNGGVDIHVYDNRKIEVKKRGNPNIADVQKTRIRGGNVQRITV